MKRLQLVQLLTLACLMSLLFGCGNEEQYADIRGFMTEIEGRDKGSIAPLPEFEPYQPFTYGASNRRSPFQPPVAVPPKTAEQRKNIGVKPPKDHVKEYLERFSLASLSMVGTLQQNNVTWALIEDSSGGVHRVQVGDYMGSQWGQIDSIDDARIGITEIVTDGARGWLRKPRTIELRGVD